MYHFFSPLWRCDPTRVMASSFLRFLDHTQRRTTVGRTPLDERSARRRNLYLTTHNTHNRQTSMPPVGLEPTISAGERPQTYALDRAAGHWDRRCTILPYTNIIPAVPTLSPILLPSVYTSVVQDGQEVTVHRPIPTFVFPNPTVSFFVVEPY
jgi:hypothetical protein